MIKESIVELSMGKDLSPEGMRESMNEIMGGEATPAQIGAFLALLKIKGESVNEITQAASVMREKAHSIDIEAPVLDTCSTGGTGLNHINISTTVAFVAAGAGIKVAKHGNRAASGKCGSADVLEKLGVNIELEPEKVKECIDSIGIGFLFAPKFHKAMKYAAAPRKEMGIRTVFNMLGPLTNPASATHQLLGVYSPRLTETLASVLGNLGVERAMVVHGEGGLDEISLSGKTKVSEFKKDSVETYDLEPEDFGLENTPLDAIKGGDEQVNAEMIRKVLNGEKCAFREYVLANSAASLVIIGKASDMKEGVKIAGESIDSGKAMKKMEELAEFTSGLQ
jgi:anthranilate phosphoribosyltransferase